MSFYSSIYEWSEKSPDKIAIEWSKTKLSYKDLIDCVNRLALKVHEEVGSGVAVPVVAGNSIETIVALLAILKSGNIFVPIDAMYPAGRIQSILDQLKPNFGLVEKKYAEQTKLMGFYEASLEWLEICSEEMLKQHDSHQIEEESDVKLSSMDEGKNAYIYFTSGSTGVPKGILGRTRSLHHFIEWEMKAFQVDSTFKVSQLTAISFDPYLRDILLPLIAGATICIPESRDVVMDGDRLVEWIKTSEIVLMHTVPTLFKNWIRCLDNEERLPHLKYIILAGEVLKGNDVKAFHSRYSETLQLVNLYGPTETTLAKFFHVIREEDVDRVILPVGKPLPFTEVLILNEALSQCAKGTVGEIYIRTPYISGGYYQQKELTQSVFIKNPFSQNDKDLLYKTGDLGRIDHDGNLEVLGRVDFQVKIRGNRIELGEIDSWMEQYPGVDHAVSGVVDIAGEKQICCYYVTEDLAIEDHLMKQFLGEKLPEYMVPNFYMKMSELPLNANGKINRLALPQPNESLENEAHLLPRNALEIDLCDIWSGVLNIRVENIRDNFFKLGGHSLKATTLVGRIKRQMAYDLSLKDVFEHPTIEGLAALIMSKDKGHYSQIVSIANASGIYPMSSAQQRMYGLQQLSPLTTAYNIPKIIKFEGTLDLEKLKAVVNTLVERHESFRTTFSLDDSQGLAQQVHESAHCVIEKHDTLTTFIRPFDLETPPLLRVGICQISEVEQVENNTSKNSQYLMFDMHHIISDGSSLRVLLEEFTQLYNGKTLEPLRIQYKDYSEWQRVRMEDLFKSQGAYWHQLFEDEIPVLNLPTDYPRPALQSHEGSRVSIVLHQETSEGLRKICQETGTTYFMLMLAGVSIWLSKYTGQEDLVIGTPIAGRPHADLERIMGMFVNTLAIRTKPEGGKSFKTYLSEVRESVLGSLENGEYPFERLVEELPVARDFSRNPLFDVMFSMQNEGSQSFQLDGLTLQGTGAENPIAKFDMSISVTEGRAGDHIAIEYCTKLFNNQTVVRMAKGLTTVFEMMVNEPEIQIESLSVLDSEEKEKILTVFSKCDVVEDENDENFEERFEEMVRKYLHEIAIVSDGKSYTYQELNERSNQIGRTLNEKGIVQGDYVAVSGRRCFDTIAAFIGVIKAKGAYVPLDPEYPAERRHFMLEDVAPKFILIDNEASLEGLADKWRGICLDLSLSKDWLDDVSAMAVETNQNSDRIGCVLFTSGTSGLPKGTLVPLRGIVRLVVKPNYIDFDQVSNMLGVATINFDASLFEIFGALLNGKKLCLLGDKGDIEASRFLEFIEAHSVDTVLLTTSFLIYLTNENEKIFKTLTHLLTGGEALPDKHIQLIYKGCPNLKIINVYGPTENTTFTTTEEVERNENGRGTLGRPISATRVYLLDKKDNPVPIGVFGELCTSGSGLALGYLNRLELTADKFVENPYESGQMMYRTGDLCRWLPDGRIEFLGRVDHQVKIRGYRIELGEIDTQVSKHPDVTAVVTLVHEESDGSKSLCCYYTAGAEGVEATTLRGYLSKTLPDYMIPGYFVRLEQMPLTANGKIERKALPKPNENTRSDNNYTAPRSRMEEALCAVWCEILGKERLSVTDNFFEIGGHSLKATALTGKISKTLGYSISLRQVFENPTVAQMALLLESTLENPYAQIEAITSRTGTYPMSSAQQRLYSLQQMDLDSTSYNMPMVLKVEGQMDQGKLENAINALIDRHEAFRTTFSLDDSQGLVQRVHETTHCVIEKHDVPTTFIRPFDLEIAPLLRVGICEIPEVEQVENKTLELNTSENKTSKNSQYLLFDMHHIISDGGSMAVLVEEFAQLYNGETLEPLRIQYKDYSEWQRARMEEDIFKSQGAYWHRQFEDEIPVLNLPTDYPRPALQSHEGSRVSMTLTPETGEGLRKICQETGTTYFMLMVAGVSVWLSKYTGQEDLVIGTPVAGRPHPDLERIMGMFVNTLAIRTKPEGDKSFKTYLSEVKESVLGSLENGEYPFERLVEELPVARDFSRNPLFDVMFSLQNAEGQTFHLDGVELSGVSVEKTIAKFDMSITVSECITGDQITIEYCTKLFKRDTVEQMVAGLVTLLEKVVLENEKDLLAYSVLTLDDQQLIKDGFNQTHRPYPKDRLAYSLFEEQAQKTPEAPAMNFNGKTYTYSEMVNRYEKLKKSFAYQGVDEGHVVAISMKRCPDLVCSIFAILGLGGIYLPIDTELPKERLNFILQDSGAQFKVTNQLEEDIAACVQETVLCESLNSLLEPKNTREVRRNEYERACYLMYTSGSTGQPKGVLIANNALVNFAWAMKDLLGNTPTSIMALTANTFDISLLELVVPLLLGHEITLANSIQAKDIQALSTYMNETTPKVIQMTPSRLVGLLSLSGELDWLKSLEKLLLGGEIFPYAMVPQLMAAGFKGQLYNLYGPTETTVWSTFDEVLPYGAESIGKPIANTQIYILDKHLQPLPVGITGEICIGGDGLAIGYLNRPELTAEKFVYHPYEINKKIYRTGDLGCWLPDGRIEFLGRADHQVKIRGFRIELGEIEGVLMSSGLVQSAAVILKGNEVISTQLVCLYQSTQTAADANEELAIKTYLRKKLPEYMIPSDYVVIEKMPLTSSGKLDRKALMSYEMKTETPPEPAELTVTESRVLDLWQQVLNPGVVDKNASFFEVGGNSILILKLAKAIENEFEMQFPPAELFVNNSIELIAKAIDKGINTNGFHHVMSLNRKLANKNLFFLHGMDGDVFYYKDIAKALTGDFNVYGIQSKKSEQLEVLPKNINALLSVYADEMIDIQPHGPFVIGGYCAGSILQLELSRMLKQRGRETQWLIMLDENVFLPEFYTKILKTKHHLARKPLIGKVTDKVCCSLIDLIGIQRAKKWAYHEEKGNTTKQNMERLVNFRYLPKEIINVPLCLIQAKASAHQMGSQEMWSSMTVNTIVHHEVEGDHQSVLFNENAVHISEILRSTIG